jgi:hypothetical protein
MIWLDDISDLEFYNPSKLYPCYTEYLFAWGDLMLQGQLPKVSNNSYGIKIFAYSADGQTLYADVSSVFYYFFGLNSNLLPYFNLTLKSWHDIFCSKGCFVLNVQVTDINGKIVFNKWTQKYSVPECFVTASGVTISLDSKSIGVDCSPVLTMVNACGKKFQKLTTTFNCMDNFTGDYYQMPTTYLSGNIGPFVYYRTSWIHADVYYVPLNIKRTVSINCRLQKVEKKRLWQLQGHSAFPYWKTREIEDMLMSENIVFAGTAYQYDGDTPFTPVTSKRCLVPSDFKLVAILSECYEFQILGCTTACG